MRFLVTPERDEDGIWEDFYDTLMAEERENEPRETLAEVKTKLGGSDS